MNFFIKSLQVLLAVVLLQQIGKSQTCISINAQAGTGASTTICSGQCATLTSTLIPVLATTSYSVGSIPYAPLSYTNGTTAIPNIDDVWSASVNIGFNFCYFGNTFNQLLIGSNGEITFDLTAAGGSEFRDVTSVLPNLIEHHPNTICGPYRDTDPSSGVGSTVTYFVSGVAPCRTFVANWSNVPLFSCINPTSTYQIILYEGTNIIDVNIQNSSACSSWQNGRGLIGIQDATGTVAVAPAGRNVLTAWSATNESWRFKPTGVPNYTVTWSGPDSFTATGLVAVPCPTATSNYTATMNVSDCSGSLSTFTSAVQVSVTPTPSITIATTQTAICQGGSSIFTASGATSYTWMPGASNSNSISVSPTTTTTYTVAGANGSCIKTSTITLVVNANPVVNAVSNPAVLCSSGSATLTGTGAQTYTWNPGALVGNTIVITPTANIQYTVVGTNSIGCSSTKTVNTTISSSPTITASSAFTTVCAGGTVALSGSGGTSYTWTPGPIVGANVIVTPTVNTTYTVVGRNAAGCTASNTIAMNVTAGITVTATATPTLICRGGTAILTASGANTYTWMPGSIASMSISVSPTNTTVYSVTGSSLSCTNTKTISVTVNAPVVNATKNPSTLCFGNTATLTATGALTYTWEPGSIVSNTVAVTPTATAIYSVTGTNTLGCTATKTINVVVAASPTVNVATLTPTICSGSSATLNASGASTYTWNPGLLTGANVAVSPTTATTYTVIGRSAAGCTSTNTITINVNPAAVVSSSASSTIICNGSATTLTANGASTYTWSPGALTGSVVSVSPTSSTNYTVTGTNTLGCTGKSIISVNVSTINVNASSTSTLLCSSNSATLSGTGALTYTWLPGGVTGNTIVASPTITTIYTVTGTNSNGCSSTKTINISVGVTPTITANTSTTSVCETNTITLTSSGATTYTWMPSSLIGGTVTAMPLVSTVYTVEGSDVNGCKTTNTVAVNVSPAPSITTTHPPSSSCAGSPVILTASGASSYTWNPGVLTGSLVSVTPSATTVYTIAATSSLSCAGSATVNVKITASPTITAIASPTAICAGTSSTLTASGAITYTWEPGTLNGTSVVVSPTASTIFTITGQTGGCTSTETISLNVITPSTITVATSSNTICAGETVTLTSTGAATYSWNPGALTGSSVAVNPTVTTTYTVDGDNGFGCIDTKTITVNVNALPTISVAATSTLLCSSGSITLTASGASSYTFNPGAINGVNAAFNPTISTQYTVTGDNSSGCVNTQTIDITVSPAFTVAATTSSNTICAGATATLTGTGASTYIWNPGAQSGNTVTVTPTITTTYTVDGDNGLGCFNSDTITITVIPVPSLSIVATSTALCSSGSITLTASGGTTFTWSPVSATTASVVDSPTITTTYTVSSENITGCISTETITINVGTNPSITITASPLGTLCAGTTATLTANGAATYTWNPSGAITNTITDAPSITTTYTITGDNGFGCTSTNTFVLEVATGTSMTVVASPTAACANSTFTLTASGATTYTWLPMNTSSTSETVTPSVSTTYTVLGDNGTCIASATVVANITPGPANVTPLVSGSITCIGDVTLTATSTSTDAVTYSWTGPSSFTSSVQSPTTTVAGDYTVSVTDVTSGCSSTTLITVGTETVIPNLTATTSGSLGCTTSVTLTATSSTTNTLTYDWSGPSSYTASVQSPTTSIAGDYTVTVNDALTGCTSSETVTIGTNTTIPSVTALTSGSLGCNGTVTLDAASTSTTLTYMWDGPSSFTSSVQSPTTSIAGDYTVTVIDALNGCSNISTVTVSTNTLVPTFTATIMAATCSGTIANNDGTIMISGYGVTDVYDLSQATTYTGTANYMAANPIPFGGLITNTLTNPATAIPYTIRVFSMNGCFADVTVTLTPTDCSTATPSANVLGMTKAASTPTFVNNNAYNVTYTIVATNASTVDLTGFSIIDNLNSTFPLPTTYSIISAPIVTSINSSLTANSNFDGSIQNDMLTPLTSTLAAGRKDTIVFTVQINPNGFFGPFNNSAIGSGFDGTITVADSSNTGFAWDPDNDGDPTNNDSATVVNLTPNTQIGVAKSGTVSGILDDKTLDVTYIISVKNLGNDTISSVKVFDSLIISSPAQYIIKSGPNTTGSLVANGNYNGVSDINLLNASSSKLAPGAIETITLMINVTPNGLRKITNVAIGEGLGANGGIVRDSSNTGTEADPNGNGIATEQGENIPTIVELPDVNLFIPEVFTPDGDGKNDFFVIKGIEGRTVNITVFNRWGNKVYQNNAYDNTWNGTPNVSGLIIGSNKLPQGTYYYVVEFEDGVDDPINGYVVLQY